MGLDFDVVVVSSMPGLDNITKQLIEMGVEENCIDDSFVIGGLESRRTFLESFASFDFRLDAACILGLT